MANVADAAPIPGQAEPPTRPSIRGLLAQTEIDLRLFGMLVALGVILLSFHVASGGKLIQPNNMITLAVQASGIAIIATGMVLVIVSRNIDLSVGSLVGIIAMSYALLMTDWFPDIFGIAPGTPFLWALALAFGIGIGAAIGAVQGFIIAYLVALAAVSAVARVVREYDRVPVERPAHRWVVVRDEDDAGAARVNVPDPVEQEGQKTAALAV